MISALAAGLIGATTLGGGEMWVSLTVDKIFCLSESSDGVGSDEPYLVALTYSPTGRKFTGQHSPVFEGVDSGESRAIKLTLANQRLNPDSWIFVVGLADCDNYDETGSWVMGHSKPRGLQCDTNTWGWIAEDIAVENLTRMAHSVNTSAMWQNAGLRGFQVQYMKTELAKILEDSRNDCLGVGEIVLSKKDLEQVRKYPKKSVPIRLTLKGDDAAYQITCSLRGSR